MSIINDVLTDLEERRGEQDERPVDLSWFLAETRRPGLYNKPQFWIFGVMLAVISVSVFTVFTASGPQDRSSVLQSVEPAHASYVAAETSVEPMTEAVDKTTSAPVDPAPAPPIKDQAEREASTIEQPQAAVEPAQSEAPIELAIAITPQRTARPMIEQSVATSANSPTRSGELVKTSRPLTAAQQDEKQFREAQSLIRRGLQLEAEELLRERLADYPRSTRCAELLASLLLSQERHAAIQALYNSLVLQGADSYQLQSLVARSLMVSGQPGEAVDMLSRRLPDVFVQAGYHEVLALAAQRSENFELSASTYQRLLQTDHRRADWWLGMAIGLDQQGLYGAAGQAYQRSLQYPGLSAGMQGYARDRIQTLVKASVSELGEG